MKLQKLTPYGKLFSHNREYLLIRPEPLPPDNWQHPYQQAWSVVFDYMDFDATTQQRYYHHVRQIVCSDALIELIAGMQEIPVEVLNEEDVINEALETAEHDPSEPTTEELNTILREFDFEEEYNAED